MPGHETSGGIWRVGHALDRRIEGQKALVELDGQRVIAPTEEKFYPALDSLRWREEKLITKRKKEDRGRELEDRRWDHGTMGGRSNQ